jgi:hypothetical protein
MGDFHFINSMVLVGAVMTLFCFGIPAWVLSIFFIDAPNGIQFAGPNTFFPGLLAICLGGVALGVLALRADRNNRGE